MKVLRSNLRSADSDFCLFLASQTSDAAELLRSISLGQIGTAHNVRKLAGSIASGDVQAMAPARSRYQA